MAVLRTTRFTVETGQAEEMVHRRNALVDAVRATYPGLTEARLARLDDTTWLDLWRWDSAASLQALVDAGPPPEAAAAFALVADATAEQADVVDER